MRSVPGPILDGVRLCACGCGESIDHRPRQARYLTRQHGQRTNDTRDRERKRVAGGTVTVYCPTCERSRELSKSSEWAVRYPLVDGVRSYECNYCARGVPLELRDKEWLSAAYAEHSASTIAGWLKVETATVTSWLRRHGIHVRGPKEAADFYFSAHVHSQKQAFKRNRQMVSGQSRHDTRPGTVKHFGS